MSAHRVVTSCKVEGIDRVPGHIVFYDGPMRPELEPLDAAEHSQWIKSGHGRSARSPAQKLSLAYASPAGPDQRR